MYHDVLVLVIALGAEPGKKGSAPFSTTSARLSSNMLCFSSMSGSVKFCPTAVRVSRWLLIERASRPLQSRK